MNTLDFIVLFGVMMQHLINGINFLTIKSLYQPSSPPTATTLKRDHCRYIAESPDGRVPQQMDIQVLSNISTLGSVLGMEDPISTK